MRNPRDSQQQVRPLQVRDFGSALGRMEIANGKKMFTSDDGLAPTYNKTYGGEMYV